MEGARLDVAKVKYQLLAMRKPDEQLAELKEKRKRLIGKCAEFRDQIDSKPLP